MDPVVANLFAVIGSIIGALLGFSGLVLVGLVIVRRLGLPQDLPEALHYSPPAPPLNFAPDRATAQATAALQARRTALFARAHALGGRGDAHIAKLGLTATELDRADEALRALETTTATANS